MSELEKLLQENMVPLQRFINFKVSNRHDAQDLLQEVCLAATKKFASLKNLYDVRLYKDEDEYLKYFGITNKIEIDVILKKERFTF